MNIFANLCCWLLTTLIPLILFLLQSKLLPNKVIIWETLEGVPVRTDGISNCTWVELTTTFIAEPIFVDARQIQ